MALGYVCDVCGKVEKAEIEEREGFLGGEYPVPPESWKWITNGHGKERKLVCTSDCALRSFNTLTAVPDIDPPEPPAS